jgi:hypothetical protein
MGALDDAIREHLELKRKQGLSEDEIKRKEAEAFGRGRGGAILGATAPEPAAEPAPASQAGEPPNAGVAEAEADVAVPEAGVAEVEADVADAGPPLPPLTDEIEPDEVLPSEALEPNHASAPPGGDFEPEPAAEPWEASGEDTEAEPDGDVLDQTPEFLEETPEQDRLWFEQKPPKDFDFD